MPGSKSDNVKVVVGAGFVLVAVAVITCFSWPRLAPWTQQQDGVGVGFVATALGFLVGYASLVLTILIFRWTGRDDDARHQELKANNEGLRSDVSGLRDDNARLREEVEKQTTQGAELLDAIHAMGETVRELGAQAQHPLPQADLSRLSDAEGTALQGMLQADEVVVTLERSGAGKGNHPWQAVTSAGRVLQVYTGGRGGGVHASVLT